MVRFYWAYRGCKSKRAFMERLEEKILNTIKKYELIEKGDNIVIGVSGGPDSMTLLHVLYRLKEKMNFKICVAHINHMIRKEADEETTYVKKICENMKVDCYIQKIDVIQKAKEQRISTELAGRKARYDFFEEVAQKVGANKIATAHHANDNAETVLMNLLRGSGTSGLKGIEAIRDGRFVRPLIECTRYEIEGYCQEKKLNPRYDETNKDNIYTRNKIRNELIPYLEEKFNPNIIEGLNRLSTIVAKEEEYFHKIVENTFEELEISVNNNEKFVTINLDTDFKFNENESQKNMIVIDLKKFNALDEVIKARLVLYTINKLMGTSQGIEKIHIEDIIKLCGNNIGNKYLMPNKNLKVFVKKGKVFFISVI